MATGRSHLPKMTVPPGSHFHPQPPVPGVLMPAQQGSGKRTGGKRECDMQAVQAKVTGEVAVASDPSRGCEGLWRGGSQLRGLPSPGLPRRVRTWGNAGWGSTRSNL